MLVSVITPTYNRESFLPETIESVRSQDYEQIEHIVVDDGSTDGTSEVLARYPSLTVIRQPNSGEPAAVNAGLARARGEILVIVNSDDPLRPNAIRRAVETFSEHPDALLAYPDWDETDAAGRTIRTMKLKDGFTFENLLRAYSIPLGPATFFRAEAIRRLGPRRLDRKYTGDLDLWMRIAAVGPLVHIPAVLGTHRVHQSAAGITARGGRMAWEISRLGPDCLAMPHGLPALLRDRRSITATGHCVALKYCGRDWRAILYHLTRAMLSHPLVAGYTLSTRGVVVAFRWLYRDPNLSVRETIRNWGRVKSKQQLR
jgi:hypothetical protein